MVIDLLSFVPTKATKDQIKNVQSQLKLLGYYPGEVDGDWGELSTAAWRRYYAAHTAVRPTSASGLSILQTAIIAAARQYVGLSEVKSNDKWDDLTTPGQDANAILLRRNLLNVSWQSGYAYCIAFSEVVWSEAFTKAGRAADFFPLSKLITLGVVDSFDRLNAAKRISKTPVPGSIFFFRHGNTSQGHAGIVTKVNDKNFDTIEGNTSPTSADVAKDREGDGIYAKSRSFNGTGGLRLLGFCNPE